MLARSSLMFVRTMVTTAPRNYLRGIKESILWTIRENPRAENAGMNLYETSVDHVNSQLWFKHFGMPDTFISWFLITELHVWMCAQRVMDDGYKRRGLATRDAMIENMWKDCATRMQKLGSIAAKKRQEGIFLIADHFKLMMLIYDEGFNKDDQALACALWRGIFLRDADFSEFRHLRTLVHYVRSNVDHLDKVPILRLCEYESFIWKPLEESIKATSAKSIQFR